MRKSASSFLVLAAAALLTSLQSYAQFQYSDEGSRQGGGTQMGLGQMLSERIQQTLRPYDRLRLSEVLQGGNQRHLEVVSLIIQSQGYNSQIQILDQGQWISSLPGSGRVVFPRAIRLENLELTSSNDVFIESISAEVQTSRGGYDDGYGHHEPQGPEIAPNSLLTLELGRRVQGQATIDLERLASQQLGVSLDGVEIERVIVDAQPLGYGRSSTLQVELNNRIQGAAKVISSAREHTPFSLNSQENVRSLKLIVHGDALIETVMIRVGQVRQQYPRGNQPRHLQSLTVSIGKEIMMNQPLELSQYLPYENRLVRSISIQGNPRRATQSQVQVLAAYQLLGQITVTQMGMAPKLQLYQPVSLRELGLQSQSPVQIDSVILEF